ncbi:MAG: hypothetical protein AAF557_18235 [Pseudomonadota bacterium]
MRADEINSTDIQVSKSAWSKPLLQQLEMIDTYGNMTMNPVDVMTGNGRTGMMIVS